MTKEKITKKNVLEAIIAYFESEDSVEVELGELTITSADFIDYANLTIDQLEQKNEKAKARAAAKRAENDVIKADIEAILTDEYQSGNDILTALIEKYPDLTKSKIVAKVNKLIKEGVAHKATAKGEGNSKIVVYALGAATEEE